MYRISYFLEPQARTCRFILIVSLAYILLPSHKYRVAHDRKMFYKYKATLCIQHATILEANEDKAHDCVMCSLLANRSFELSARYVVFS